MNNQDFIPAQEFAGGTALPIYKGYAVDYRLREFRKIDDGGLLISHALQEQVGDELLAEMIMKGLVPQATLSELF